MRALCKINPQVFHSDGEIVDFGALQISVADLPLLENIEIIDDVATVGVTSISLDDNSGEVAALAICNGK